MVFALSLIARNVLEIDAEGGVTFRFSGSDRVNRFPGRSILVAARIVNGQGIIICQGNRRDLDRFG